MADVVVEKQITNVYKQEEQQQTKEIKHSEVGHKSLLQSDALYQVSNHSHINFNHGLKLV